MCGVRVGFSYYSVCVMQIASVSISSTAPACANSVSFENGGGFSFFFFFFFEEEEEEEDEEEEEEEEEEDDGCEYERWAFHPIITRRRSRRG